MKIISYKFSGVKNIIDTQEVKFIKKKREYLTFLTDDQMFELEDNNVKGIFGLNGSGKSAAISSLFVFKDLVMNKFIIENPNAINHLFMKQLISKKTNVMNIEIEFIVKNILYHISVELKKDDDLIYISNQKLVKKNNLLRSKKIIIFDNDEKSSFFLLRDKNAVIEENDLKNILTFFGNFVIVPSINDSLNFESTRSIELPKDLIDIIKETESANPFVIKLGSNVIVRDIDDYKKKIDFFKLLVQKKIKTELKDIKIISRPIQQEGEKFIIEDIIMQYDYDVSIRYESSGIKRLFNIFEALFLNIRKDKIIIVDELDVYLHNSLIKDMILFIKFYSKCQFIFVTHDLMVMNYLDDSAKSIVLVKKDHSLMELPFGNGNTILNKYLKGMYEEENNVNLYDLYKETNE